MCLRFVFLLITRVASGLRLSRREEMWKTAEILIMRHQLAVLQRRQPQRPKLTWADRALLAVLLGVIPNARRQGLRERAAEAGMLVGLLAAVASEVLLDSELPTIALMAVGYLAPNVDRVGALFARPADE